MVYLLLVRGHLHYEYSWQLLGLAIPFQATHKFGVFLGRKSVYLDEELLMILEIYTTVWQEKSKESQGYKQPKEWPWF